VQLKKNIDKLEVTSMIGRVLSHDRNHHLKNHFKNMLCEDTLHFYYIRSIAKETVHSISL